MSDLAADRIQVALGILREAGKSNQTTNHHRPAIRAFGRWFCENRRLRDNPAQGIKGFNVAADRIHEQRALIPDEATWMIRGAQGGSTVQGMTGPARARLYALALGTGFRASELSSLTPKRFNQAVDPPTLTITAAYAKNGEDVVQPLPPALAARLAPCRPVFDLMPVKTAELFRVDLEAAGISYGIESRVVDFHALTGCYISHLVSSGAWVKTCKTLARHSSPSLTIGVYAKASLHDISGAVDALPNLSRSPSSETVAGSATGTDGRHIKKLRAQHLPTGGDFLGRLLAI